jgi:diaminopimelate decarboxylase
MFRFRNGSLHAESVPLEAMAREYGTPCYVYSRAARGRVMADGTKMHLIRERERPEALFALEHLLR